MPAGFPVAATQFNDVVGRTEHAGIVFNDYNGVAGIAQLAQKADQPSGVARVQADARLVQDKQCVDEAGAKARGQVNARSRFPADRERVARSKDK